MSTLAIIAPTIAPTPQAAPGKFVDAQASERPSDVPRTGVVVQLSEQVRELSDAEKQETDERNDEFRGRQQSGQLSDEQKQEVRELKKTDREVRSHEAAHKAAAGAYARGAAQFETVVGPDGRRYAVGGEVGIDASPVSGNPEATVRKMEQVARAALAPSDPSAQDRAVAAQARQAGAEARREIILERAEEQKAREAEAAKVDASANGDGPNARVSLQAPASERADRAAEPRGEASVHGHSAQDTCPLCQAQTAPPARAHGGLDLSA